MKAQLAGNGRSLSEHAAKAALRAYGLPMVGERLVMSEAEALTAAEEIGFPVVMKGLADGLEHKSDAGLVHLNLKDAGGARAAYGDLAEKLAGQTLNGQPAPCVVQQMVTGGVEVILGMQNDPDFGTMILVGVGGVMTELLDDVALRRAPLSRRDVKDMIGETRLGMLLQGLPGRAPRADRAALEDAILRLSDLAVELCAGDREHRHQPAAGAARGRRLCRGGCPDRKTGGGHPMTDLLNSPEDMAFRKEIRDFVAAELDPDTRAKVVRGAPLVRDDFMMWHRSLYQKGWAAPGWAQGTWRAGMERPPAPDRG